MDPSPYFSNETALAPRGAGASAGTLLAVAPDGARLLANPTPDPALTDGYLRLTARILLAAERGGARTVGVFGPRASDGGTSAAVNLAVCLGRTLGRTGRVLLVDGDARSRTLSRLFCGPAAPGERGRHPMRVGTALEGVDLLTAPAPDDPLAIAAPGAWIRTFNDLGAVYPHVVVDCPPVLESAEGLVLRECVDRLVLVLRAGRAPRRLVERTVGPVRDRVIGVLLHGGTEAHAPEGRR